jgi:hypothetical protein
MDTGIVKERIHRFAHIPSPFDDVALFTRRMPIVWAEFAVSSDFRAGCAPRVPYRA